MAELPMGTPVGVRNFLVVVLQCRGIALLLNSEGIIFYPFSSRAYFIIHLNYKCTQPYSTWPELLEV